MRQHMRRDADKDILHRDLRIRRHHIDIQPDRRRHQADLGGDDHDDAEPDRIETQGSHHRQDDGDSEEQDRHLIQKAAEHQVQQDDQREDNPARDVQIRHIGYQILGESGQREIIAEYLGADDDQHDHAGRPGRIEQGVTEAVPGQPPADRGDHHGAEGTEACRFGRRGNAEIDAAGHQHDQRDHGADDPEGGQLLPQRVAGSGRRVGRIDRRERQHRQRDHYGDEQAGYDSRDQQPADAYLRNQAVQNDGDGGWDQHRQGAGNGHDTRGKSRIVVVPDHRRNTGSRQRGCRRRRRAGDRAEAGTRKGRRYRQTGRGPPQPDLGTVEQLVGDPADDDELGHKHEHRHGDQLVGRGGRQRRAAQDAQHDIQTALEIEAHHAGNAQREGHRHAEDQQQEQYDESDRDDHPACSP